MNYVIGSGPAGVSAALALLAKGEPVTMLDAGGSLEPHIQAHVNNMAARLPEDWSAAERDMLRGPMRYTAEGAPVKFSFGSDYQYRDLDVLQPVSTEGVEAYRSFSTGGLSVLWGASVLPYSDADLQGWPLTPSQLAPHYASVLEMSGLSARSDALAELYPLYAEPTTDLSFSSQAQFMMDRMESHSAALEDKKVLFGKARLAIAKPKGTLPSCTYCGMCLYGCSYDLIYSTRMTLQDRLLRSKNFSYVPGVIVRKLVEHGGSVQIQAISRDDGRSQHFEASRVYLAAGVYASTAILLESLESRDKPLLIRQSEDFILPMLLKGFRGRVSEERLHTLSQIFIEILDRSISGHTVHLQLYTYNDFYSRMAKDKLGPLFPMAAPLVNKFIERTALIKGYLHSDESSGISAVLEGPSNGSSGPPVLKLSAVKNPRSRKIINTVVKFLSKNNDHFGATPFRPGMRQGLPGSGAHVGGSFPMRKDPAGFESDELGRPVGLDRVHVVDSSVFPSVPATTITLTIMANAHRIASQS